MRIAYMHAWWIAIAVMMAALMVAAIVIGSVGLSMAARGGQGPRGPRGIRGATGEAGVSTSATGATGAQGATGAMGVAANTGATGPDGSTGPEGEPGFDGDTGPTGPGSENSWPTTFIDNTNPFTIPNITTLGVPQTYVMVAPGSANVEWYLPTICPTGQVLRLLNQSSNHVWVSAQLTDVGMTAFGPLWSGNTMFGGSYIDACVQRCSDGICPHMLTMTNVRAPTQYLELQRAVNDPFAGRWQLLSNFGVAYGDCGV